MAIIKIIKRDCPYVTIDKTGIDDPNLSWAATGLLTYLIGRPGNWKINITHLSGVKLDGERATRGALLELREANYCHYFEIRKKGKVVETIYLVFEVPISYEEAIKNYIDLKDDEQILYKEVKKKEPKVQNEVSVKSIENKEVLPKVQNAKTNNAKGENEGLLIIDTTNNRTTNKKTTTSENKKSSSSLEENSSGKEMINELLKKYTNISYRITDIDKVKKINYTKAILKKISKDQLIIFSILACFFYLMIFIGFSLDSYQVRYESPLLTEQYYSLKGKSKNTIKIYGDNEKKIVTLDEINEAQKDTKIILTKEPINVGFLIFISIASVIVLLPFILSVNEYRIDKRVNTFFYKRNKT